MSARTIDVPTIRHFPTPADRVFDAWISPAEIRGWFGPGLGELTRLEIDAHEGGSFFITQRRTHGEVGHWGQYLIVDRPYCLAFTWNVTGAQHADIVTVALLATDAGCKVKVTHQLDASTGAAGPTRKGWARMLDAMCRVLRAEACA
ncbi:MAG: SRPBCC domain-containing protein [Pigmentiphaga sp.]|uniref:SRPBCC family protein n=1 Tax=Pigmentiphaga sp. TaxID=1977564 RepID=UPI0029B8172E|nr:SRPBCC domain-containing protein [Pigmentiphaga sp.]MDX3905512.1 SRPBCC domain-containing protein [Pigmentiphaga sp.]